MVRLTGGIDLKPAVFLDRDGTIIKHVHHLVDPALVQLLPGVPDAILRLQLHGFACVVVTNQSVVGRGLLSEEGLQQIHEEMAKQLSSFEIRLDGVYSCFKVPEQSDPCVIEHPDRKPGPGMIFRAAQELSLNINRSWMIGDSISDVMAGRNAGCEGAILLATPESCKHRLSISPPPIKAATLSAAADVILCHSW